MNTIDVRSITLDEQLTAVADAELPVAEIGPFLAKAYHAVATACGAQSVQLTGPPFARYHRLDEDRFTIEAGFPVAAAIDRDGDVRPSSLPGGPAAVIVHVGPYEQMVLTYDALVAWIKRHDGEPAGEAWEIYLSDPRHEPDPATWRTEIVQPYRTA